MISLFLICVYFVVIVESGFNAAKLHYRKAFKFLNQLGVGLAIIIRYNMTKMATKCQICQKQAYFNCSQCENAFYCSKQHQIEHWKSGHKSNCFKPRQNNDQLLNTLLKKRYHTRKQFYDNYSNKIFDICLLDAKVMVDFDKRIKQITKDLYDEYEYGASICLLCRVYYLCKDKNNARIVLQNYLSQCQDFLTNFEGLPDINKNFTDREKQVYQRKMNLLSTIANLSYALELDCIKYYVLYTKHVEKTFGKQSFEASNCYFLIGCYFAEEGFLKKSIACFLKSAACRGQQAGDCYFNIGILYGFQKKWTKAIEMLQMAFKLRMEQYGEDSDQLAEVEENMGMIYVELNDFITAMIEYEKAFKIRSINPYSAQYRNVIELIHQLYDKLCLFINSEQDQLKKPSIFLHLKSKILDEDVYWKQRASKKQSIKKELQEHAQIDSKPKKSVNELVTEVSQVNNKNESLLIISEQLMLHLNSAELFQLSDLQLQLSTCTSLFSSVYLVGRSQFLQKISSQNLSILKRDNPRLFELLRLQQLLKRK